MTFGHLTHTMSSNTVWDVRVGRFDFNRNDDPSTGSLTTPSRTDARHQRLSGAPQTFGGLMLIRTTVKGDPQPLPAAAPGRRSSVEDRRPAREGASTSCRRSFRPVSGIVDNRRTAVSAASRAHPSIMGGVFITTAAFVSDAITVGNRLTINAGLRFDHSRAISQDLPMLDAQGHETGGVVSGLGALYTWNVWSPRLGVTMRLTADGRTMLRASYGRFNQGVLTGELAPFHPGATPTTTGDLRSGDRRLHEQHLRGRSEKEPAVRSRDTRRRAPTSTPSASIVRSAARLAVAVAYIRKDGGNFIGWTDVGGQYREDTRPLPDGRTVPVLVLVNAPADRRFLLTNQPDYSMTYNGLVMAVEKRRSPRLAGVRLLHLLAGRRGCRSPAGQLQPASQVSTISGSPFLTFGQDPNSLTNARGRLPNDRPHMLRAMGSVDRAPDRVPAGRQPATLQRQAVGGHRADRCWRRETRASCSNRAARAGCRRRRSSTSACREPSPSAARRASSCSWTFSTRSMTRRRRGWRPTICSARISASPTCSSIRAARWSACG